MSLRTLENFLKHYGLTKEDIEIAQRKGVYQKGKWLLVFDHDKNEVQLWKNPDSISLKSERGI